MKEYVLMYYGVLVGGLVLYVSASWAANKIADWMGWK